MATTDTLTAWDFSSSKLPYYDQLYKTALRMTRSVPESEDLLQETYLKAFRYYSGFEEGTNLKAWLFRIMKNNFINGYRKRKIQPQQVELDELRDSSDDSSGLDFGIVEESPEAAAMSDEMDDDVATAINALPHDYKMAVTARRHPGADLSRGGGHARSAGWHGHVTPLSGPFKGREGADHLRETLQLPDEPAAEGERRFDRRRGTLRPVRTPERSRRSPFRVKGGER